MGAFVDSVGLIFSRVERRVEVAAQNISNVSTPGYKRGVSFEILLDAETAIVPGGEFSGKPGMRIGSQMALDVSTGALQATGRPEDLALTGNGFFCVRTKGDVLVYTRQGQFQRDVDGHLVNPQGAVLQLRGGGDLVLKSGDFKVLGDGTITQEGEATARIGVVDITDPTVLTYVDGGLYSAPENASLTFMDDPSVAQGALEASNVSLGSEMTSVMAAMREAQSGQRLMMIYDDLMGRAVTTFGQG